MEIIQQIISYWYIVLPVTIIIYFLYHSILKVWLSIQLIQFKYGKKVCTYFYPMYGPFIKNQRQRSFNKEDHLGHKMMVDHVINNPESQLLVSNNKSNLVYYLHDPNLIQEFLHKKMHYYKKEGNKEIYLFLEDLLLQGITTSEGAQWKYLRQVSAPAFHFKLIAQKIKYAKQYANVFIEEIEKHRKSGSKVPFDTQFHALNVTGSNLISSLMGEKFIEQSVDKSNILHEQEDLVAQAVVAIAMQSPRNYIRNFLFPNRKIHQMPQWLVSDNERRILKRIKSYTDLIDKYIINRIEETKKEQIEDIPDFLQFHINELLKEGTKTDQEIKKMTITIIRHQFTNMVAAGIGAPTSTLTSVLWNIAYRPEWQETLRQEMQEQFDFEADNDTMFRTMMNEMPILDSFIKECMRRYSPSSGIFQYRKAQQDHYLGEFHIKKGQSMLINILGNSHNPRIYENPESFDPTRWYEEMDSEGNRKIHSFSFLPFLGGKRNCIGQHFAKQELKLTVLMILRKYRLKSTDVKYQTNYFMNLKAENGCLVDYIPLEQQ